MLPSSTYGKTTNMFVFVTFFNHNFEKKINLVISLSNGNGNIFLHIPSYSLELAGNLSVKMQLLARSAVVTV